KGPIAAQAKEILGAVAFKEGQVGQWRSLSKAAAQPNATDEAKEKLAAQTKKVEEADAKIREAARPRKLRFEITPAEGLGCRLRLGVRSPKPQAAHGVTVSSARTRSRAPAVTGTHRPRASCNDTGTSTRSRPASAPGRSAFAAPPRPRR